MKFMRGERLLQQINEDSSLGDLTSNIVRGFPDTKKRQHATDPISIVQLKLVPYVATKDLHCKGLARSDGKTYEPEILFLHVEYQEEDNFDNITFTASDGEEYNALPIKLGKSNVKVQCNCLDFHYRFAQHNHNDDSLVGDPPPPYQKKTNRPPVNPLKVPGVCKHLIKLADALKQAQLVSY